jgi:hypothetical protein
VEVVDYLHRMTGETLGFESSVAMRPRITSSQARDLASSVREWERHLRRPGPPTRGGQVYIR